MISAIAEPSCPAVRPIRDGAGELLRKLETARDAHPYWDNRLFQACRSGALMLDDFRFVFSQYYVYSRSFTRCLLALLCRLEDEKHRAQLVSNLHDEGGGADVERRHTELFRNFLTRGLSVDPEAVAAADCTKTFVREYLDFSSHPDPVAACAFLSLGTESIVARSYAIFVDAMLRAGVKEVHLEFFRVHMDCDDAHAATLAEIMRAFSHRPDWYQTSLGAMDRALSLRRSFFESLFETVQYRRIQRIVENVDARRSLVEETRATEGFGGFHADLREPAPLLYSNKVDRLNVDFAVQRLPFKCEVLEPRLVRIPPGKWNEKHRHAHETIFYCLEGRGQVLIDDEHVDIRQGDLVFVPRWAVHQSQNQGDGELVLLAITDHGLTGKAFLGNYYRTTRGKEDLFQKYSVVDHIDRAFWADPYPLLRRAREESPVCYSETFDAWFLTRYSDVASALRDPRLSSRRATFKFAGLPPDLREEMRPFESSMARWMIFNDPPDHTRLRGFCSRLFSPRTVQSMRRSIQTAVDELIDAVADRGRMDVMRDLASPLPGLIVADMMGVVGADRRRFEQWSDDIASFAGASESRRELAEAALGSWRAMTACIQEIVEQRLRSPRDDFLTSLLSASSSGDRLTEEEVLATCVVLLAAGHGATQDTICNGLLTLLRHPRALEEVRGNPALLESTGMDELLRYESALQLASRVALEELEIDGHRISKGQRVMAMLGAANRDPEQFPDPDRLDLHRADNRHLAFGTGAHHCIGGPLGRLEATVAISAILRRLPGIHSTGEEIEWKTRISFRGVQALPVVF